MSHENMIIDYEEQEYYEHEWETMSFDFGLDEDRINDVIDVEYIREYVNTKPIVNRAPIPISLSKYPEKILLENLQTKPEEEKEQKQEEIVENETVQPRLIWGKKIKIDEDSDSDSDSEISRVPTVTKSDLDFPTINQASIMKVQKKNTDFSNGWIEVGKTKEQIALSDNKEIKNILKKTKLCESVKTGKQCRHGRNCRYAHSVEELVVCTCVFGTDCKFVVCINGNYRNNGNKNCSHLHTNEKLEDYYVRTGLKKRGPPTEEEMQQACDYFFLQLEKDKLPKEKYKHFPTFQFRKFENVQNKPKKVAIKEQQRKLVTESLETQKIKHKNDISIKLRQAKLEISRKSETIDRFKRMTNTPEFYKKQIKKLESEIATLTNDVTDLEERLKNVDSMKKVEIVQPIIEEKKSEPIVVKEVKKPVVKKEVSVVLVFPQKPVENKSVKIKPVEIKAVEIKPVEDEGWVEVKNVRDRGFDILKDKTIMETVLTCTRMCTFGKDCKRGKNCRFAHNKEQLNVRVCAFGNCCKFVIRNSRGFENVNNDRICMNKHPEEHINNFYFRVGIDKVPVRSQPQVKPQPILVSTKPVLNINAKS